MAIIRTPLITDPASKCSRWRVIIYNPSTSKQEWHTVSGTRREAEAFERQQKERLARGTYVSKIQRMTVGEVAASFLKECKARNRRTSTMLNYQSVLGCYILPKFSTKEAGSLRKADVRAWLGELIESGKSVELVNRIIRVLKAVLFHGVADLEVIDRNVMLRFKQYERTESSPGRRVARDAFSEAEVQAILEAARPHERALIGLLVFTGLRPGEAFALDWSAVDLTAGSLRVERSWDHRGRKFVEPKTKAGHRVVPISGWLVAELTAHRERCGGTGLVFPSRTGQPLNPSNVRRDIWLPLKTRAKVRDLDLYSLRHSFASLGRTAGESAFNVARMMGHSRSTLVDQVYAHSMQSGMASVAESVTSRVLGVKPQLRVIEGGARDVRQPLDESPAEAKNVG